MNSKELLNEILLENSNFEEALKGAEYTSQTEALIQMLKRKKGNCRLF